VARDPMAASSPNRLPAHDFTVYEVIFAEQWTRNTIGFVPAICA